MGIFTKNKQTPVKMLESELAALKDRRLRLSSKLFQANQAVAEAVATRRKSLLEDDADSGTLPRVQIGNLRDEAAELEGALAALDSKIITTQDALAVEHDRERRAEAVAVLETATDSLATALEAFTKAGDTLLEALSPVTSRMPVVLGIVVDRTRTKAVLDDLQSATRLLISEGTQAQQAVPKLNQYKSR